MAMTCALVFQLADAVRADGGYRLAMETATTVVRSALACRCHESEEVKVMVKTTVEKGRAAAPFAAGNGDVRKLTGTTRR